MSDCDYTMCGDMDCADCYPRREVDRLRTVLAGLAATVEALEAERDDLHARLDAECSRRLSVAKDRDEARAELAASRDREAVLREALLDVGSWYRSDADEFHVVHRALNATESAAAAWRRGIEAGALEREADACCTTPYMRAQEDLAHVAAWLRERAAALRAGEPKS